MSESILESFFSVKPRTQPLMYRLLLTGRRWTVSEIGDRLATKSLAIHKTSRPDCGGAALKNSYYTLTNNNIDNYYFLF